MSQPPEDLPPLQTLEISKPKKPRKQKSPSPHNDTSITLEMPVPLRLLVCSIGNPAPYTNTLHSIGHLVLTSLCTHLSYPAFTRSRSHGNGLLSEGSDFTLWQSQSLMNISGPGVAAAWKRFKTEAGTAGTGLVIVHDELELEMGQVKVRDGQASAKGHNGLKDIQRVVQGQGVKWWRIGVGIGRPESRERGDVSAYVLRKVQGTERRKLEGCVGVVEKELRRLGGW